MAVILGALACLLMVSQSASAQTDETKADTIRMSQLISEQTGVPTVAGVVPRAGIYDVDVQFMGPVTNYQGVMGVLIGAVGEATRQSSYTTEWCYITTQERGRERILTSDIRRVQSLALSRQLNEAWQVFVDNKKAMN